MISAPGPVIGRVVATELLPASPHQFHFWTATNTAVGIGAIVRVDGPGRTAYGVVLDARAYSDLAAPLDDVVAVQHRQVDLVVCRVHDLDAILLERVREAPPRVCLLEVPHPHTLDRLVATT